MEKIALSVREVARTVGLHPATIRKLIQNGRIPAVRVNAKYLVPKNAILRMFGGD